MRWWQATGIALASSVIAAANAAALAVVLRRRLGPLELGRLAATAWRVAIATAFAITIWALVARFVATTMPLGSMSDIVLLGVGAGAATVVYFAVCMALRVEEMQLLRSLLRRRADRH
jgi:putative peptidoglycan lipid II flippase